MRKAGSSAGPLGRAVALLAGNSPLGEKTLFDATNYLYTPKPPSGQIFPGIGCKLPEGRGKQSNLQPAEPRAQSNPKQSHAALLNTRKPQN